MASKYNLLADTLRHDIKQSLAPGDMLPPQRELMRLHKVSFATVDRALKILIDEGLITRHIGRGTFVSDGSKKDGEKRIVILLSAAPISSIASNWIRELVYEGIQSVLEKANLSLIISGYDNAENLISDGNFKGLIFMMPSEDLRTAVKKFQVFRLPSVVISTSWPDIDIPSIDSDNEYGIRCALRHLAERGHTKVGYVDQPYNTCHVLRRRAAFKDMSSEFGIQTRGDWNLVMECNYLSEETSNKLKCMFTAEDRPTALLFSSFLPSTMKIVAELKNMGLSLPEDVSLIGFDDSPWAECMEPALTVIEQPLMEMGRRAAERLLQQINYEPYINREVLPVEIVRRSSVAIARNGKNSEVLSSY